MPGSGCAVTLSSGLSHRRDSPSPEATNTSCRPSGESAKETGSDVAGVLISTRISGASAGGASRKCATASVTIAIRDTAAMPIQNRSLVRDNAGAAISGGPLSACSISIRTSAASLRRFFSSFSRHNRNSFLIAAGTPAGSRFQSGSPFRISAKISAPVPLKVGCPVSIS